jgi:predicted DNA-binding protein (UPF0251 family)
MMDQATYDTLRDRYRVDGDVHKDLYSYLDRLVRAIVFGSKLAPAYSPTGSWDDDSIQDALHGWIARRLIQTNALLAAFDFAEHPGPFLNSLEQNFRHYLENERERGELGNLLGRTGRLFREDNAFEEFVPRKIPSEAWWGLRSWREPDSFQGSDDGLVAQAWALGEVPLFRYSASVRRASPVLSAETLRDFLIGLFERIEATITINHLAVVFNRRFDLGRPQELVLDEVLVEEVADPELANEADAEQVRTATASLVAEFSPRQLEALLLKYQGKTLEEIAEALGVSRGTADNALRSAGPLIEKHCVDGVTRDMILEKVLDVLS